MKGFTRGARGVLRGRKWLVLAATMAAVLGAIVIPELVNATGTITLTSSPPPSPTNSTSYQFAWSNSSATTTNCDLDGTVTTNCTSPFSVSGLSGAGINGTQHSFTVTAADSSGTDTATWTVDTTAPTTTIDSGPAEGSTVTVDSATFGFSSPDGGASFECQLDGGGFSACAGSKAYTLLASGSHTFDVRSTDAAGNTSALATRHWTVDTLPPAVTILTGPPAGGYTNAASGSFTYSVNKTPTTDTCTIDAAAAVPCAGSFAFTNLADGVHTFLVTATDSALRAATASRTFTVDTVAPVVTVTAPPNGSFTNGTTATFTYSAVDASPFTYTCTLDGVVLASCGTTPGTAVVGSTASPLAEGLHTFQVTATDAALWKSAPAAVNLIVDRTAPKAVAAVRGLQAVVGSPNVSWDASAGDPPPATAPTAATSGVAQYQVFRGAPSPTNAPVCTLPLASTLSCIDTTAPAGNDAYVVRTLDAAGNFADSAPYVINVDPTSVTAVRQLAAARPVTKDPPQLTWTAPASSSFGSHYVIYRDAQKLSPLATQTSFADDKTKVTPPLTDGQHSYQVQSFDANGTPGTVSASIKVIYDTVPPSPTKGFVVGPACGRQQLAWTNPATDFDHALVVARRSRRPTGPKDGRIVYDGTKGSAHFHTPIGKSDYFAVYAFDAAGNASPAVYARSPAERLCPAVRVLRGQPTFAWKSVKGATYYNIQILAGANPGAHERPTTQGWPANASFQLPAGARLKKGKTYSWYVWPGYGKRSAFKYGGQIGHRTFRYR